MSIISIVDDSNRQHWSFTRQLAFGDSSHWDESTSKTKAFKKLISRWMLRLIVVLLVFILACLVYYLRMKERELDRKLQNKWLLEHSTDNATTLRPMLFIEAGPRRNLTVFLQEADV